MYDDQFDIDRYIDSHSDELEVEFSMEDLKINEQEEQEPDYS